METGIEIQFINYHGGFTSHKEVLDGHVQVSLRKSSLARLSRTSDRWAKKIHRRLRSVVLLLITKSVSYH